MRVPLGHMAAVMAAFSLSAGPAAAQTAAGSEAASFNERFEGRWDGGGNVVLSNDPRDPVNVSCTVNGQGNAQQIAISGTCRAAVIFGREIAANLTYDPASDRYVGTYVGSKAGPARLEGRRSGDTVTLNVTYAQPVGSDRSAVMTIRHQGGNQFSLTVTDDLGQGPQPTTQLAFAQR
ncbi:MAG TPA: hypothetical protein VHG92_02130 [Afifellaceae bacterium]|nr:hypothetical protein [Afifellaceae bacterium]